MENRKHIIKHRWFWAWQDEQEEQWLSDLARHGVHLVKPDFLGKYTFTTGEPRNWQYRLDFRPGTKKDEAEYLQFFQDSGWELAGTLSSWYYFRKEIQPGEVAEIFTDNHSKAEKYKRLLLLFAIIIFPVYIMVISPAGFSRYGLFGKIVDIIYAILFIIYIYIFASLFIRLTRLMKHK
jgi:hypothetical protein